MASGSLWPPTASNAEERAEARTLAAGGDAEAAKQLCPARFVNKSSNAWWFQFEEGAEPPRCGECDSMPWDGGMDAPDGFGEDDGFGCGACDCCAMSNCEGGYVYW